MVDVTDVACEIGDPVTMIGADGDDSITVNELAELGELSPYEVLTGLRGRLPGRYIEAES
jgi:alanine racemase